jgi:hypothetical protein
MEGGEEGDEEAANEEGREETVGQARLNLALGVGTYGVLRSSNATMAIKRWARGARNGMLACVLLALSACGGSTSGTSPTTRPRLGVVTGRVTAGPTCPVERVGHACPPRPVVGDVQARADARVVASARSGAYGTYRLELPSGSYTLDAVTQNLLPRCTALTVTVTSGQTTSADITCDTGIR